MATGRDLRARLVLNLRDEASAGLQRITGRLNNIRDGLRRLSMAAGVIAGLNFLGPAQEAARFDDTLRQNAITAGLTGQALEDMIRRNGRAFEQLALRTGQTSQAVAEAAGTMIAAGMDDEMVRRLLPTIAQVATGAGASMNDLASTAFQLQQQLGITAEQMPQVFASLIQAGRDGNFELRDMAREFPSILAAARALGMQGAGAVNVLAAALQSARTASGTSAEAANNLLNALQKMASPEVRDNFRDIGVDLSAVLRDAARQGINPLEALVQKLRERTGGSLERLSEIFGDRQALMGLLPMIQDVDRYLRIRDRAAAASPDLIPQAMQDRLRGAQTQMVQVGEALTQLSRRFQVVAFGGLPWLVGALQGLVAWLGRVEEASPGLIENILFWPVAFIAAAAAIGILGQVLGFLGAGIVVALAPIRLLFGALGGLIRIFGLLMRLVNVVLGVFGLGVTVVGALAAALVYAAFTIWENWGEFAPHFRALWEAVKQVFRGGVDFVTALIAGDWSAAFEALVNVWRGLGNALGAIFEIAKGIVTHFVADVMAIIQPAIDAFNAFREGWNRAGQQPVPGPAREAEGGVNGRFARRARRDPAWDAPDEPAPEAVLPRATSSSTQRVAGEIVVRAAPGTEIVETRATEGSIAITAPRGATRDRP